MKCLITGCAMYVVDFERWIWGDLYYDEAKGIYAMNTKGCYWAHEPMGDRKALIVDKMANVGQPVNDVYIIHQGKAFLNSQAGAYIGGRP